MSLTIYAPASIGNVSVGFDLLGAALAPIDGSLLGDTVRIEAARHTETDTQKNQQHIELVTNGHWANKLPADPKLNIVWQCAKFFLQTQKINAGIKLILKKNLPIGSGLGSSASSVVATFYALNQYFNMPYTPQALLALMGEFEGKISGSVHYDNVAPCYLGGMQLVLQQTKQLCEPLPIFKNWYWVIAYSGESLATAKMRQLLPSSHKHNICIEFGRNLAAFIHACYRQDAKLALSVLTDVLAEPYRANAITGFNLAKKALSSLGMDATGISGSGPTLFSITCDLNLAKQAADWLVEHHINHTDGFVKVCQLDHQGARIISNETV